MASEWQGGPNFHKIKRSQGKGTKAHPAGPGDGKARKRFGDAGTRRKNRFNPNPTWSNHPNCQILAQSRADKGKYDPRNRPIKIIVSGVRPHG